VGALPPNTPRWLRTWCVEIVKYTNGKLENLPVIHSASSNAANADVRHMSKLKLLLRFREIQRLLVSRNQNKYKHVDAI